MGVFSFLDPFLNIIFGPLLNLIPFWGIAIISFLIALMINLIIKYFTDQSLMKQLKDEMKDFQKEMKELRSHPEKAMAVQKKAMQTNMKYMMHSMRATLITFIPIIIIFGWLHMHLAYVPIIPNQEFTTTVIFEKGIVGNVSIILPDGLDVINGEVQMIEGNQARWVLKGERGDYLLEYKYEDISETKDLLVTYEKNYADPVKPKPSFFGGGDVNAPFKMLKIDNGPLKPMGDLSILGWRPGWLATYIILSIIFSLGLKKLLKVY